MSKLEEQEKASFQHFSGVAQSAFDGLIKEVDLRGSVARLKLILATGGMEIDCIASNIDVETFRSVLDRRVWVEGEAIYSGKSPLPERLDISKITVIKPHRDIYRWRGSFQPFEVSGWEGDA